MGATQTREQLDALLEPWRTLIGVDFEGYRNHCRRMVTFCLALRECSAEEEHKIAIAACFHDIGIWTAGTLDYLPPSVPPAVDYLRSINAESWGEEISLMITEHHKLSAYEVERFPLVEAFRKADLVDFSLGLVKFGLPGGFVREIKQQYPNAGFHRMLVRRAAAWFVRHPLNPAPMMKW
jgi:hypothetical protein